VVSLGNQIDLDVVDFLNYFKNDPETKIIAMYIENLKRDGHDFVQLLKESTVEKPVIIWKGGVSETGNSAVMSHTGGLAGKYEMWQAMAKQTGVLLVDNFEQLSYLIRGFLTYPIPKTLGTAPISGGGGLAIEATDALERVRIPTSNRIGIEIPQLTQKARNKLAEFVLGVNTSVKNPLDFGAQGFDLDVVVKAVNILSEEMKDISTVMFINSPEVLINYAFRFVKKEEEIEKLQNLKPIDLLKTSIDKWINSMKSDQLLMSITAEQYSTKEALANRYDYVSLLREKGIMSFNTVGEAAKVLLQMWTYGQYLKKHK